VSASERCQLCGDALTHDHERAMCVCGECLADQREDDHDVTIASNEDAA